MKCKNCGKALRKYYNGFDQNGKATYLLLHINNSEICNKPEPKEER